KSVPRTANQQGGAWPFALRQGVARRQRPPGAEKNAQEPRVESAAKALDALAARCQSEGMSMYTATVPQLCKMLRNMEGWLDKAEAHAAARKFDVNVLLSARLAPDLFPLVRQVQSACDTAKFLAARLAGKEAPSDPDTETTFAEIRARIQKTAAFVATIEEADFKDA